MSANPFDNLGPTASLQRLVSMLQEGQKRKPQRAEDKVKLRNAKKPKGPQDGKRRDADGNEIPPANVVVYDPKKDSKIGDARKPGKGKSRSAASSTSQGLGHDTPGAGKDRTEFEDDRIDWVREQPDYDAKDRPSVYKPPTKTASKAVADGEKKAIPPFKPGNVAAKKKLVPGSGATDYPKPHDTEPQSPLVADSKKIPAPKKKKIPALGKPSVIRVSPVR